MSFAPQLRPSEMCVCRQCASPELPHQATQNNRHRSKQLRSILLIPAPLFFFCLLAESLCGICQIPVRRDRPHPLCLSTSRQRARERRGEQPSTAVVRGAKRRGGSSALMRNLKRRESKVCLQAGKKGRLPHCERFSFESAESFMPRHSLKEESKRGHFLNTI